MTIIAWDGQYLSADQRISYNNTDDPAANYESDHGNKLIKLNNPILLDGSRITWAGVCGSVRVSRNIVRVLDQRARNSPNTELLNIVGIFGNQLDMPSASVLFITTANTAGILRFKAVNGLFKPSVELVTKLPAAIGSGKSAMELVRVLQVKDSRHVASVATLVDKACGGEIFYVEGNSTTPALYDPVVDREQLILIAAGFAKQLGVKSQSTAAHVDVYGDLAKDIADSEYWGV
jgi:hypothetical protein